jgi:hypothetical protein
MTMTRPFLCLAVVLTTACSADQQAVDGLDSPAATEQALLASPETQQLLGIKKWRAARYEDGTEVFGLAADGTVLARLEARAASSDQNPGGFEVMSTFPAAGYTERDAQGVVLYGDGEIQVEHQLWTDLLAQQMTPAKEPGQTDQQVGLSTAALTLHDKIAAVLDREAAGPVICSLCDPDGPGAHHSCTLFIKTCYDTSECSDGKVLTCGGYLCGIC